MTTACNATSMRRRGDNNAGKNDPEHSLGIFTVKVPRGGGDQLVAGPVALRGAVLAALVQTGTDALARLGIDHRLQDTAEETAHELTAVGGAEHLDHLEQGRIV